MAHELFAWFLWNLGCEQVPTPHQLVLGLVGSVLAIAVGWAVLVLWLSA